MVKIVLLGVNFMLLILAPSHGFAEDTLLLITVVIVRLVN